jgi:oxalate decarboxylase
MTWARARVGSSPPGSRIRSRDSAGEGCEFLLVFDDGNFNEDETFLLSDWLSCTPRDVLAKNFGVSASAFANIPEKELYIFKSKVPGPIAKDRVAGLGPFPLGLTHRMSSMEPIRMKYGQVRILDSSVFPVTTTAAALVECASCTGTRTPMSGSTTFRARRG